MGEATSSIRTPLGWLALRADAKGIVAAEFAPDAERRDGDAAAEAHLARAAEALARYFAGEVGPFGVPLSPHGTPYQRRVWARLAAIPPGATATYQDIAADVGGVARSVGRANGANPIAVLIPCHRVVRTGGDLGGYAGGLERKRWLLDHEAGLAGDAGPLFRA